MQDSFQPCLCFCFGGDTHPDTAKLSDDLTNGVSIPGAIGMYALSLGVQKMSETLPEPAYSLLSGLNASTVGVVALAAVHLSEKAIRDKLSRILVIFGACAGLCYNALWYFPVLMIIGGFLTSIWDGWLNQQFLRARLAWENRHRRPQQPDEANDDAIVMGDTPLEGNRVERSGTMRSRGTDPRVEGPPRSAVDTTSPTPSVEANVQQHIIRIRVGLLIMFLFFGAHPVLTRFLSINTNIISFLYFNSCCQRTGHHTSTCSRPLRQYVPCWDCYLRWRSCCYSTLTLLCRRSRMGFW